MSEVVSLAEHREKNSPHTAGVIVCLQCRAEHVAVAKAEPGASFDCPSCGTGLAIFKYPASPPAGTEVFECACGSEVFYVLRTGIWCWKCGSEKPFPTA